MNIRDVKIKTDILRAKQNIILKAYYTLKHIVNRLNDGNLLCEH